MVVLLMAAVTGKAQGLALKTNTDTGGTPCVLQKTKQDLTFL